MRRSTSRPDTAEGGQAGCRHDNYVGRVHGTWAYGMWADVCTACGAVRATIDGTESTTRITGTGRDVEQCTRYMLAVLFVNVSASRCAAVTNTVGRLDLLRDKHMFLV